MELKVLLLERDGVVEEEQRNIIEHLGDNVLGEILIERARDVGEHEGDFAG